MSASPVLRLFLTGLHFTPLGSPLRGVGIKAGCAGPHIIMLYEFLLIAARKLNYLIYIRQGRVTPLDYRNAENAKPVAGNALHAVVPISKGCTMTPASSSMTSLNSI